MIIEYFSVVINYELITVGDEYSFNKIYNQSFEIEDCCNARQAYLDIVVTGVNVSKIDKAKAEIKINNKVIGSLYINPGANGTEWQHQRFIFNGNILKHGNNMFSIVGSPFSNFGLDMFRVKNINCHFHR